MNQVPDFWRTEVLHPLSVHFPIAFLLFATAAYLLSLLFKSERQRSWKFMAKTLLYVGVAMTWIGIYTGDLAEGVVNRTLCDPTVLKDHEVAAYTFSILFTAAAALQLVQDFYLAARGARIVQWLMLVLLLAGSGYLSYAGHLGATVVYQQGAGVYHPTEDCAEFN